MSVYFATIIITVRKALYIIYNYWKVTRNTTRYSSKIRRHCCFYPCWTTFTARCVRQNESSRYCHDVRPSVRLPGTGVHCDYTMQVSADLSLWLDSPMFWAPWHQSMSTYTPSRLFTVSPGREAAYGCANWVWQFKHCCRYTLSYY